VPDSLTRGALTLLGDAALDAQCASTVLSFAPAASQPVSVAADTLMTLQDSDPPLVLRVCRRSHCFRWLRVLAAGLRAATLPAVPEFP